ncbi:MAG: alpha/beta fold hydrolase [Elainellaceae cyanobacterium]
MGITPELLQLNTITAADGDDAAPFPIRLWDYSLEDVAPEAETVLVIHGRRGLLPDRTLPLEQLYPRLAQLAEQIAEQGKRVLFLDWGEAAVGSLPPFGPAGRIRAVAEWAKDQLDSLNLSALTLVGHSLGSYVAAEIAEAFAEPPPAVSGEVVPPTAVNLVALDPAFPAQNYDIDGLTAGEQGVADFSPALGQTSPQRESLAFVAEDDLFLTGLAGDNEQATTAETSFVVDLDGLRGPLDADNAHGAVIDVYRDFERYLQPTDTATSWVLAQFPRDRIDNGGSQDDDGRHEGVAFAAQVDEIWKISAVEGDGVMLHFIEQADEQAELGTGEELDIVASLISLHLPLEFEHLVLGGQADLTGTGRGENNRLYGNRGNNRLEGRAGDDEIYGSDGDDFLVGNSGGDRLLGQKGEDHLWGDVGNDVLLGGAQADVLSGGAGRNRLRGGGGRDTFWLEATAGLDIIEDFEDGLDQLALTAGLAIDDLQFVSRQTGVLIRGAGDAIALLNGVTADQLGADDFALSTAIEPL